MGAIAVWGTWHLGSVHAACLAELGNRVRATDPDPAVVAGLSQGNAPLYEPGLAEMLRKHLATGRLSIHSPDDSELGRADAIFLTADTEVDDDDRVHLASVESLAEAAARTAQRDVPVVMASQVPAGTTERLVARMSELSGRVLRPVCMPENLRLGTALENFLRPDRLVIGSTDAAAADAILALYGLDCPVLRMGLRSAEMSKHALNAYLGTLISFASETADLCEAVGADAYDVERALRADGRVSPKAPLRPGFGFAGGTLGRDVQILRELARARGVQSPLMDAVLSVNRARTRRLVDQLSRALGGLGGRAVTLLGLAYKPGTDTLRRSIALEIARELGAAGARVSAFDPRISRLPASAPPIVLAADALAAARGADVVVIVTEWPEFARLDWVRMGAAMRRPLVFDLKGLLDPAIAGIELRRIGVPA
jgi:UDPglucose 6-dehydrogenase